MRTLFISNDGMRFDSAKECMEHEAKRRFSVRDDILRRVNRYKRVRLPLDFKTYMTWKKKRVCDLPKESYGSERERYYLIMSERYNAYTKLRESVKEYKDLRRRLDCENKRIRGER